MKAYVCSEYGEPEKVLSQVDLPKPIPKDDEVLVRIHNTSVNDYDWACIVGKPIIYRLLFGIGKPRAKFRIPGMEMSGKIEQVGSKITKFKIGDKVYGDTSNDNFGTFSEYICLKVESLTSKPPKMSFDEAASVPHASMLAFQGLVEKGQIKNNQKVLINGGGGGVGTFGLQLAKMYNAEVTGIDTGEKLQLMIELGFNKVFDYKKVNFTKLADKYDIILDCKTKYSPGAYAKVLKPQGKYVTVGGDIGKFLRILLFNPFMSIFSKKRYYIVALEPNKDLGYINELFEAGQLKCIIEGPYPFEKIPWAVSRFGKGHHFGKVVISCNNE